MEKKIAGAMTVIHNDGTLEDLERTVDEYLSQLPSPN
jgi:dephospho-CoA kinase